MSLARIFLRDIHKNNLSIKNSDNEQSDLFKTFGNLDKGKSSEKISFLKNVKKIFKVRKNVLNGFKSNLFPI